MKDAQVSRICKAFGDGSSANIKFSIIQLPKMVQPRESFIPDPFGLSYSFPTFKMTNSIASLFDFQLRVHD